MIEENLNISLILLEVLRGYSIFTHNNKTFYFKHFLLSENLALDEFELQCIEQAKRDGIKSEKDLIDFAIKQNFWSKKQEEKIQSLNWTINKAEIASSKITDNVQKIAFNKSIDSQKKELSELTSKRNSIVLYSAENCAAHKKNTRLIETSIFMDEKLTIPAEFNEAYEIIPNLNERLKKLSDSNNLIRAAYNDSFFELYNLMYRDPFTLIKKDLFTITVLQKNLLIYASAILNKLKNIEMPDDIKQDPIKIIKFKPSENKSAKTTEGIEDIRQKLSANNGKLKAEDLLI